MIGQIGYLKNNNRNRLKNRKQLGHFLLFHLPFKPCQQIYLLFSVMPSYTIVCNFFPLYVFLGRGAGNVFHFGFLEQTVLKETSMCEKSNVMSKTNIKISTQVIVWIGQRKFSIRIYVFAKKKNLVLLHCSHKQSTTLLDYYFLNFPCLNLCQVLYILFFTNFSGFQDIINKSNVTMDYGTGLGINIQTSASTHRN